MDPVPRLSNDDCQALASPAAQWRTLGALFAAGGLLVLLNLGLGVDESVDVALVGATAASAVLTGALLLGFAARLPARLLAAGLGLAVVMVTIGVVGSHEADTPFGLLYIWIAVNGWYFLSPRQSVVVTVLTVGASAGAMAVAANPEDNALSWWIMVAGTVIAVSALAASLRLHADRVVAELAEAASRDPLTGLLNRGALRERAEAELARARRHGVPVAVLLADIDHFKSINDVYGHEAGDDVLRRMAALIGTTSRTEDIAARLGGEEFIIVLPDTGPVGAMAAAERLRVATRESLPPVPGARPVTVSIGVATFPDDADTLDELLATADRAMYEAKSLGRDRSARRGEDPYVSVDPAGPARPLSPRRGQIGASRQRDAASRCPGTGP